MNLSVRRRVAERHASATVRAVSGRPSADLRAQRLRVDDRTVALASPHLAADLGEVGLARGRGVADNLGLLLRHTDLDIHRSMAPESTLERVVFDLLEQLRCESLAPESYAGMQANLDVAFRAWTAQALHDRIDDSGVGLLVFTVTHMVRARLGHPLQVEGLDEVTEQTRGMLSIHIGGPLRAMRSLTADQQAYGDAALDIAQLIGEIAGDAAIAPATAALLQRHRLLLSPLDDAADDVVSAGQVGLGRLATSSPPALDQVGDYQVYSTAYDHQVDASTLIPLAQQIRRRAELDAYRRAQGVSTARLAQRLRAHLASPSDDGWERAVEEGYVDAGRLARLVVDPLERRIFRRPDTAPRADVSVSFLIDNSGSMKRQRYETVAVLVDTLSHALDLAGVENEVLGFTTGGWTGAGLAQQWRRDGQPDNPGRLNELQHIVYKDAGTPWRRARRSLATQLSTHHYRESVDGEAIVWAHQRLMGRSARRRLLVVISDGSPMDSATANANREGFLDDHLHDVAQWVERWSPVELGAIGIDGDVSSVFSRSVARDLTGTLSLSAYGVLEELFASSRGVRGTSQGLKSRHVYQR